MRDMVHLIWLDIAHNPICVSRTDMYRHIIDQSLALLDGNSKSTKAPLQVGEGIAEETCRSYCLFYLINLTTLNGTPVTDEERVQAKERYSNGNKHHGGLTLLLTR